MTDARSDADPLIVKYQAARLFSPEERFKQSIQDVQKPDEGDNKEVTNTQKETGDLATFYLSFPEIYYSKETTEKITKMQNEYIAHLAEHSRAKLEEKKELTPREKYWLAYGYFNNGMGVVQDAAKGLSLLQEAAEGNDREAKTALGILYINGDKHANPPIPRQLEKGVPLLFEAAEKGNSRAMNLLGQLHEQELKGYIEKNLEASRQWYEKAAEKGHPDAIMKLAQIYENQNNIQKARYWYEKGVEVGIPEALVKLGVILLSSKESADSEKALRYLDLAAEANVAPAFYQLGLADLAPQNLYEKARGFRTAKNWLKATYYFRRALELGYLDESQKQSIKKELALLRSTMAGHVKEEDRIEVKYHIIMGLFHNDKLTRTYQLAELAKENIAAFIHLNSREGWPDLASVVEFLDEVTRKKINAAVDKYQENLRQTIFPFFRHANVVTDLTLQYLKRPEVSSDDLLLIDCDRAYQIPFENRWNDFLEGDDIAFLYIYNRKSCYHSFERVEEVNLFLKDKISELFKKDKIQLTSREKIILGMAYHEGIGVKQNSEEAKRFYQAATEDPSTEALALNMLYLLKNEDAFLTQAVSKGSEFAIWNLGLKYEKSDKDQYVFYLRKAGEKIFIALYDLGVFFKKINFEEAYSWFEKAAKQGSIDAIHQIGFAFTENDKERNDFNRAIKFLSFAAERAALMAAVHLAKAYKQAAKFYDSCGNDYPIRAKCAKYYLKYILQIKKIKESVAQLEIKLAERKPAENKANDFAFISEDLAAVKARIPELESDSLDTITLLKKQLRWTPDPSWFGSKNIEYFKIEYYIALGCDDNEKLRRLELKNPTLFKQVSDELASEEHPTYLPKESKDDKKSTARPPF